MKVVVKIFMLIILFIMPVFSGLGIKTGIEKVMCSSEIVVVGKVDSEPVDKVQTENYHINGSNKDLAFSFNIRKFNLKVESVLKGKLKRKNFEINYNEGIVDDSAVFEITGSGLERKLIKNDDAIFFLNFDKNEDVKLLRAEPLKKKEEVLNLISKKKCEQ